MKRFFTQNLGLKLISLVIAFFLWLFMYNSSDPDGVRQMTVPITLRNENTLEDNGLTYQVVDDMTSVQVSVRAPLSVRNALTESDIQVVADFSKVTAEYTVALEASCSRYRSSVEELALEKPVLQLEVEKLVTRQMTVGINLSGEPRAGYAVVSSGVSPNRVTITGPESQMERLDALNVTVSVDDVNSGFESTAKIQAYDEGGYVMDMTRMELSDMDVLATVGVSETKNVDIQVTPKGKCAVGYGVREVTVTPRTVTLYGDESLLQETDAIVIPSSQLDISGATSDVERKINLTTLLPEGLQLAGSSEVVRVVAVVEQETSRSVKIPVTGILQINVPAGYNVSFGTVTEITIPLTGLESTLESLTAESLKPTVDLGGLGAGTHEISVGLTLPDGVVQGSDVKVQVTLNESAG